MLTGDCGQIRHTNQNKMKNPYTLTIQDAGVIARPFASIDAAKRFAERYLRSHGYGTAQVVRRRDQTVVAESRVREREGGRVLESTDFRYLTGGGSGGQHGEQTSAAANPAIVAAADAPCTESAQQPARGPEQQPVPIRVEEESCVSAGCAHSSQRISTGSEAASEETLMDQRKNDTPDYRNDNAAAIRDFHERTTRHIAYRKTLPMNAWLRPPTKDEI